ncbi:MAG: AAA family ATPase [Dehalococcoidales bacterium]|nr:AAA family ATPase [Dehalococcoidales bacterium]
MAELPELIQALLNPNLYPEPAARVELMQTQMSFVLITGDYVYKIKKPVNLGYLDYTTLDKRLALCRKELELNRRLCPDAYLAIVPIVKRDGKYALGGAGEAIEYAVKMRRLPREGMMDVLLPQDKVTTEMLAGLAAKLSDFHSRAATGQGINQFGSITAVRTNTDENFTQVAPYLGRTITNRRYQRIKEYTNTFIAENVPLFERRVADGKIRDCHGDLHAAHICFADGICIYDCIEFNDRFRYCDVVSEIAFLAMDLDHYGRADLSASFVNAYAAASGDTDLKTLLRFYKCYRAYVRGKVGCFQLDDPHITDTEKPKILANTQSYFDLAAAYTRAKPLLLITVGLVGTGKSTLAHNLAKRMGLAVISSDVTRKRLAGIPATERHYDEFDRGLYSSDSTRRTYDAMFAGARDFLKAGISVILDASFIKAAERRTAKELADAAGADFYIVECTLSETAIKKRLETRRRQASVSDGRLEILTPQQQNFEPVAEVPPERHFKVDTAQPREDSASHVVELIGID